MIRVGQAAQAPPFQEAAKALLTNLQLRKNVRHATDIIKRCGTDYEAAQHALSLILRFRHRAPNPAAVEAEPQPRLS